MRRLTLGAALLLSACQGPQGEQGPKGDPGAPGAVVIPDFATVDASGVADLSIGDGPTPINPGVPCNKHWDIEFASATQQFWYAEISVPGFNPRFPKLMTATICDPKEFIGSYMMFFGGAVQAGTTYAPALGACKATTVESMSDGVVRVFCGVTQVSGTTTTQQSVFQTAYLKVEP